MATAAEYKEQLKLLLPPGHAFPRDPGTNIDALLDGLSIELARSDEHGTRLTLDANPLSTSSLLVDWERVAGLPDTCAGALEETIQGRRNALVAKLSGTGGQSPAYFITLAQALGYTISIQEFRPFRAGRSAAGNLLTNGAWVFAWMVHAPSVTVIAFRAGRSAAGEPLRSWGNDALECKLNQLKPAHTILLFAYGD